eukprot:gene13788-17610_t
MQNTPPEEREDYDCKQNVEWACDRDFILGEGAEATIYMGLMKCLAIVEDGEENKITVAVKQNFGKGFVNSHEIAHFTSMTAKPGVVKYLTNFFLKHGTIKFDILVQDLGCLTLRQLVLGRIVPSAHGSSKNDTNPVSLLTEEDKFKITKALCKAVDALHSQDPRIIHRDLRPENVLIMNNG